MMPLLDADTNLCTVCGVESPTRVQVVSEHGFIINCSCGATESFEHHDWVYTTDGATADPNHFGARQMRAIKEIAAQHKLGKRQHTEQLVAHSEPGPDLPDPAEVRAVVDRTRNATRPRPSS